MKIKAKLQNTTPKEFEYDSDRLGKRLTTIHSKNGRNAIIVLTGEGHAERLSMPFDQIKNWRDKLMRAHCITHKIGLFRNMVTLELWSQSYWTVYEFPTEQDASEWWQKYIRDFDQKVIKPYQI